MGRGQWCSTPIQEQLHGHTARLDAAAGPSAKHIGRWASERDDPLPICPTVRLRWPSWVGQTIPRYLRVCGIGIDGDTGAGRFHIAERIRRTGAQVVDKELVGGERLQLEWEAPAFGAAGQLPRPVIDTHLHLCHA